MRRQAAFYYYATVEVLALAIYIVSEFSVWMTCGSVGPNPDLVVLALAPLVLFVRRVVLAYDW